ncbi:MAG: aminoacyl-tRNA hydrolase [Bacilli bacterium]|jgi:PTH1 family peptidyl-tRNA hydrolase
MKIIVGLGNPGKEYELSRHNMGYRVLDCLSIKLKTEIKIIDFDGVYGKRKIDGEDIVLLKPTTFMNLSGQSVQEISHFFKVSTQDLLIIYDDMALPPGQIRLREQGSSGGHKGIQNIIDFLGTDAIKRIRVGVGEPVSDPINYVLGKVADKDKIVTDESVEKAAKAVEDYLSYGFHHAMSSFN